MFDIISFMKYIFIVLSLLLLSGCFSSPQVKREELPNTTLVKNDFAALLSFNNENFDEVFALFQKNCQTQKAQKLYGDLCNTGNIKNKREFFTKNFDLYKIVAKKKETTGLLTGYYEPLLHGSLKKSKIYKYPIYATPKDLVVVDLGAIYPELKHYRLRGKLQDNKLVPYFTRAEFEKNALTSAEVLCYCDSKIERFFLEVQGSGKVQLDNNTTINVGYSNQNGHKYSSIGKYLIQKGVIAKEDISLQSIKRWLEENPSQVDNILNYNKSMVFFEQKDQGATGSLGLELTPKRSVAVDRKYIPLGSVLYMDTDHKDIDPHIVFAQDTGGAIKGPLRVDLFLGSSQKAQEIAGRLKEKVDLWILLPKKRIDE